MVKNMAQFARVRFILQSALLAVVAMAYWHPVFGNSLEALCKPDAAKYDALQSFKSRTTPQRVAEVYLQSFLVSAADSDTQAVWRRVLNDQIPLDEALNEYVEQYPDSTSNSEKEIVISRIRNQISDMQRIYELVLGFEEIALNSDTVMAVVTEGWRRNERQLARPLKYYLGLVDEKIRFYRSSAGGNLKEDEASVRAVVETQAAVDRDRGVPRQAIIDKGHGCYKERLNFTELWLREKAVTQQAGGLNEEEYNFVKSKTRGDPMNVSRLEYYTHFKFGPRDYSFDRFKAWQMAANSPVTTAKNCPAPNVRSTIESMIKENRRDEIDYPRNWRKPNWNMGVPTVAEANQYSRALEQEFLKIADKAEASGDTLRIYSAAYWFIDNSDPSIFTIRRTDYKGQECDIIRNRIVALLGDNAWEGVMKHILSTPPINRGNIKKLIELALKEAIESLPRYADNPYELIEDYQNADKLIDDLTRPPTFNSERMRILTSVAQRTGQTMIRNGHGDCTYYENAVYAWDYLRWKDQTLREELPVDWEHNFMQSVAECLTGK